MLNFYRENLIAMRRASEADRLFVSEMRSVIKEAPGLGIEIYSEQISDIFKRTTDKNEIFSYYQDILRNSVPCQNECFRKIASPLAKLFYDIGDYRSAQKVATLFISFARDADVKESAKKLQENMKKPKDLKKNKKDDADDLEESDGSKDDKNSKKKSVRK